MTDKKLLYIYLHIPKCAGTTIRIHIEKNIPENQRLPLYPISLNLLKEKNVNLSKIRKAFLEKYSHLINTNILYLYGHNAFYGIHKYFPSRKPFYFTFIRDPNERIVSLYNYWCTISNNLGKHSDFTYKLKRHFLINDKPPEFTEWFKHKYLRSNSSKSYVNYLKRLNYKKNGQPDLSKFDFIGITEKKEDFYYLYNLLRFHNFFSDRNKSEKYVTLDKVISEISPHTRSDHTLYNDALNINTSYHLKHNTKIPLLYKMKIKFKSNIWHYSRQLRNMIIR